MRVMWFWILAALLFSCAPPMAHADDLTMERRAAVQWVKDNTDNKLSDKKIKGIINGAWSTARLNDLNPLLVLSVMKVESNFKENSKSAYGAKGLMQVVPRFHNDKLRGRSPYDSHTSIEVGTQILKDCWDKHRKNLYKTLSCYSGGGGKKYYNKVVNEQKHLKKFIIQTKAGDEENFFAEINSHNKERTSEI